MQVFNEAPPHGAATAAIGKPALVQAVLQTAAALVHLTASASSCCRCRCDAYKPQGPMEAVTLQCRHMQRCTSLFLSLAATAV